MGKKQLSFHQRAEKLKAAAAEMDAKIKELTNQYQVAAELLPVGTVVTFRIGTEVVWAEIMAHHYGGVLMEFCDLERDILMIRPPWDMPIDTWIHELPKQEKK